MSLTDLAPLLALVVGAAAALLVAMFAGRGGQRWPAGVALLALATSGGLHAVQLARPAQPAFEGAWALDGATAIAAVIVCGLVALSLLLAPEWLASDPRGGEYHALAVLAGLGAIVMAAALDLNLLVVGVTLSSVTGYVLAAYHRSSALSVEAGMNYFLIGGLANLTVLIGVVLAFAAAGTTDYGAWSTAMAGADGWLLVPAAAALTAGLAFKAGAAPAHGWVPDVGQGAPIPSAALLTTVPKVGGTIALARLVTALPAASGAPAAVAAVAAATMTLGNLAALRQDDVRRLLGWSSVAQAGYALMGVAAAATSEVAVGALLLFLAAYGVSNVAAFAAVGWLRGRTALTDYHGLARQRPAAAWTLTIALLSLVGIPPLAGFAGKLALFTAAVDGGLGWLAALAVANTVLSLAYYLRVVAAMHLRAPDGVPVHLLGAWTRTGALLALAATVGLALVGEPIVGAAGALLP